MMMAARMVAFAFVDTEGHGDGSIRPCLTTATVPMEIVVPLLFAGVIHRSTLGRQGMVTVTMMVITILGERRNTPPFSAIFCFADSCVRVCLLRCSSRFA